MKQRNHFFRKSFIETLEQRMVLSTAPAFELMGNVVYDNDAGTITLAADVPLHIGIDGWDVESTNLSYAISSNNPNVDAKIIENGQTTLNRSMVITVQYVQDNVTYTDTMTLELFEERAPETTARLIELINSDFYNTEDQDYTMLFHRVIDNFMMQTGDPDGDGTGGSGIQIDDEFNIELRHAGSGTLSMAKSRDDTTDSQFFITDAPTRWLDFQHSVVGQLTEGEDVRDLLNSVDTNSQNKPISDIIIKNIEIIDDTENAVLMLAADEDAIGQDTTVTVTVTDENGDTYSEDFDVVVQADTVNDPPFLEDIDPLQTDAGQPVGFTPSAVDVENDFVFFGVWDSDYWYGPYKDTFVIDYDPTGGTVVVTPQSAGGGGSGILVGCTTVSPGFIDYRGIRPEDWAVELKDEIISYYQGAYDYYYSDYYDAYIDAGQSSSNAAYYADSAAFEKVLSTYNGTWDFQFVPVYVNPSTPTSVALASGSDTGLSQTDQITNINGDSGDKLSFVVSGTTPGTTVSVYVDDQLVGTAAATGDTTTVVSTDPVLLDDGQHEVTVRQTLADRTINVGNYADKPGVENPVDLDSALSDPFAIWIDSEAPTIETLPSEDATERTAYNSQIEANETVSYSLVQGPTGMTVDSASGAIHWTPGHSYGGQQVDVTIQATDPAGNATEHQYTITVEDVEFPPQLSVQSPTEVVSGTTYNANISALDPDGEAEGFRFEVLGDAPDGLAIDESTGEILWNVPASYSGTVSLQVQVTELLPGNVPNQAATIGFGFKVYDAEVLAAQIAMQQMLAQQESGGNLISNAAPTSSDPLDLLAVSRSTGGQQAFSDQYYSSLGGGQPLATSSIGGFSMSPYDSIGRIGPALDSNSGEDKEGSEHETKPTIQDAGSLLPGLAVKETNDTETDTPPETVTVQHAPSETIAEQPAPEEILPEETA